MMLGRYDCFCLSFVTFFVKDGFAKELWCSLSGRLSVLISYLLFEWIQLISLAVVGSILWTVFDYLHGCLVWFHLTLGWT